MQDSLVVGIIWTQVSLKLVINYQRTHSPGSVNLGGGQIKQFIFCSSSEVREVLSI